MYISFFVCVKISFALGSQREPHSQWNIGGGGSPTQNFCVGHVDFMLFLSISFALGSQREPHFQWNMGYKLHSELLRGYVAYVVTTLFLCLSYYKDLFVCSLCFQQFMYMIRYAI